MIHMSRSKLEKLIEVFCETHQLEAYWCNMEEGEIRVQFLCEEYEDDDE